ncbi:MAG: acyl-ACP--UDP-N-acetylglucosamine O-acyltransferase [Armatimonadetes bacterium]|nr:acyl-ACP--UDP-N-acetylglucosamine O-acyltransferase [Armatimonadota bacterium]
MPQIHPLSVVDPMAELADDVIVGPFCDVQAGVILGAGTKLDSHVTIKGGTTIGERNYFGQGSIIGGDPQDRKYKGEPTYLTIGDDNFFREYVTIHRATGEGQSTRVGNHCYFMAFVHLGHNVVVEDGVTMANSVGVSGHCTIEELATLGGMVGLHQWVRVGKVSMVGGMSGITRDVPPFMIVEGRDCEVRDINAVGLRRYGISSEGRMALHKACKLLYKSQLGLTNAIETVKREVAVTPEVQTLIDFELRRFKGKNGRGDQP